MNTVSGEINRKSYKINLFKEKNIVIVGFLFSLLHPTTLFLSMLFLLFFLRQNSKGCIKALLLITTRTIVSPAIGIPISNMQMFKWILIFGFSFWILFHLNITDKKDKEIAKKYSLSLGLFILYCSLSSIFYSSYPIVSTFKLFSYFIVCYSVVLGVASSYKEFDWLEYFIDLLMPIFLFSFVVIPLASFRIINSSFQGVLNQPNMFGIIAALFIAAITCKISYDKFNMKYHTMLIICLIMLYLSDSRTGMISSFVVLSIYFFLNNTNLNVKILFISMFFVVILATLLLHPEIMNMLNQEINNFLLKGNEQSILFSREGQINTFIQKFKSNPYIGTGFAVPYIPNYRTFQMRFDVLVEPGNLILAVIGDCGIIGATLFLLLLIFIFFQNRGRKVILFIAPLLISFGEMVFFSTNNMAIFLYLFYGIYIFDKK